MTASVSLESLLDLSGGRFGKSDVACPWCGPSRHHADNRKRRVLRIWLTDDWATYNCARCGEKGWVRKNGGAGPRPTPPKPRPTLEADADDHREAERRQAAAMRVWADTIELKGTFGAHYFAHHRKLAIGDLGLDHVLRWHERISAVVSLMTDPIINEPTGVHRTFLDPDGTKRERKMLGRQGVIRLSPDEDVLEGLGICEGVETGLRILLSGWAPVWAATSANGVARFLVLSGIESLTIFVDDDSTGISATQSCAEYWTAADREVRLARPKDAFDYGI